MVSRPRPVHVLIDWNRLASAEVVEIHAVLAVEGEVAIEV